jgi:hypothetical protein
VIDDLDAIRIDPAVIEDALDKVKCWECNDSGRMVNGLYAVSGEPEFIPCPYCGAIRALRAERGALRQTLWSRERDLEAKEVLITGLRAEQDALLEAAGKVTCARCMGSGLKYPQIAQGYSADPCPDCADLRALLNNNKD